MTRPDDIPEDVWATAVARSDVLDPGYPDEVIAARIADAIMDERERCAKVALARAEIWRAGKGKCALPLQEECEDIATAIRKGSGNG